MTIFETSWFWIAAFIVGWIAAQFLLAPIAGRFIRFGSHDDPPGELHPMPSGSMSDRVSP